MNLSFELALQVRLAWMQAELCRSIGLFKAQQEEAQRAYRLMDQLVGLELGPDAHYGGRTPPLILQVAALASSYRSARADAQWYQDALEAAEAEARAQREDDLQDRALQQLRQLETEAAIAAEDWARLRLPTPEQLLARLLAHEWVEVQHHSLKYDLEDGWTWLTNPYGVDGLLCDRAPTLDDCRQFLLQVANGEDYGPVP